MSKYPKWFRASSKPYPPGKPLPPSKFKQSQKKDFLPTCCSVGNLMEELSKFHKDSTVEVESDGGCSCCSSVDVSLVVYGLEELSEKEYGYLMRKYEKALLKYEEKLKEYERQSKEWPALKAIFDVEKAAKKKERAAIRQAKKANGVDGGQIS